MANVKTRHSIFLASAIGLLVFTASSPFPAQPDITQNTCDGVGCGDSHRCVVETYKSPINHRTDLRPACVEPQDVED